MSLAPAIVGIVLIIFSIVALVKLVKDVFIALVMVGILILGIFMLVQSVPELADKVGFDNIKDKLDDSKESDAKIKLPAGVDKILLSVKGKSENLDIVASGVDDKGNLLVVVANTGRDDLEDFVIYVEDKSITWKNDPLIPLGSGKSTVFQTNYRPVGEVNIEVKAGNVSASYP